MQTYAFFCFLKDLKSYGLNFPGELAANRLEVIRDGEIGFSQGMLKAKKRITSLSMPDEVLDYQNISETSQPDFDFKEDVAYVENLPFRYKFKLYRNSLKSVECRVKFFIYKKLT